MTHHDIPGNVLYAGFGRPCPQCKCFFMNQYDYDNHQCRSLDRIDWKKGEGNKEWCSITKAPEMEQLVKQHKGSVLMGHYKYTVSKNRRWLQRQPQ